VSTPKEYTCVVCHETYEFPPEEEWSDDDAKQERKDLFGGPVEPTDGLCCDDCFKAMVKP
tara:strand:+ start:481 stop:660 length:180 start_codon:yes stop_codon:yes gene_type:complete